MKLAAVQRYFQIRCVCCGGGRLAFKPSESRDTIIL